MEKSMKKQIISRNIRFWGAYTEKMFLLVFGIGVLYSVLMPILSDEDMSGMQQLLVKAVYVVMLEALMVWMLSFWFPMYNLPLALSFGSGRREAMLGVQFSYLLAIGQELLLFGVTELLAGCAVGLEGQDFLMYAGVYFAAAAGILLAIAAVGQIGMVLPLKYGGKGMAFSIVMFTLGLVIGGLLIGFSIAQGEMKGEEIVSMLLEVHTLQILKKIAGTLITIDVVVYAVGFLLLRRTLLRYEVRM